MRILHFKQLLLMASLTGMIVSCDPQSSSQSDHHEHASEVDFERGPHRGRMLRDHDFAIELLIEEKGHPPVWNAYASDLGEALPASAVSIEVTTKRLNQEIAQFILSAYGSLATSSDTVQEPHSFTVDVRATYKGKTHHWSFESFENRTTFTPEVVTASGIGSTTAEMRKIHREMTMRGKMTPSEHLIAHVIPRFSGIVREGRKHIGDHVAKGEVVAIIESNQSLQPYEVRSQIEGSVISGHIIVGEFVPDSQPVYIIADLSELWIDFLVPFDQTNFAQIGMPIEISSLNGGAIGVAAISYIAPYIDERTQARLIRATFKNSPAVASPGSYVMGRLLEDAGNPVVTVENNAIQKIGNSSVIFRHSGNIFEAQPVVLGKSDQAFTEIISGLKAGERYVNKNSFLIKADILKSGASHDH